MNSLTCSPLSLNNCDGPVKQAISSMPAYEMGSALEVDKLCNSEMQ